MTAPSALLAAYDAPHALPYTVTVTSGTHSVTSDFRSDFEKLGRIVGHETVGRILDAIDARQFWVAAEVAHEAGISIAYSDPSSRRDVYGVPALGGAA